MEASAAGQAGPHADEMLREHLTQTHAQAIDAVKFHERELFRARSVVDACNAAMESFNAAEKGAAEGERVAGMAAERIAGA